MSRSLLFAALVGHLVLTSQARCADSDSPDVAQAGATSCPAGGSLLAPGAGQRAFLQTSHGVDMAQLFNETGRAPGGNTTGGAYRTTQGCQCEDVWEFNGTIYEGCAEAAKDHNSWCYIKGEECAEGRPWFHFGVAWDYCYTVAETSAYLTRHGCHCMPKYTLNNETTSGCAYRDEFGLGRYGCVVWESDVLCPGSKPVEGTELQYDDCSISDAEVPLAEGLSAVDKLDAAGDSGCHCLPLWDYHGGVYQGCATTPDRESWCYVVEDDRLCPDARVESDSRMRWMSCGLSYSANGPLLSGTNDTVNATANTTADATANATVNATETATANATVNTTDATANSTAESMPNATTATPDEMASSAAMPEEVGEDEGAPDDEEESDDIVVNETDDEGNTQHIHYHVHHHDGDGDEDAEVEEGDASATNRTTGAEQSSAVRWGSAIGAMGVSALAHVVLRKHA